MSHDFYCRLLCKQIWIDENKMGRKAKELSNEVKEMVWKMLQDGITITYVSETFGIPRSTIQSLLEIYIFTLRTILTSLCSWLRIVGVKALFYSKCDKLANYFRLWPDHGCQIFMRLITIPILMFNSWQISFFPH